MIRPGKAYFVGMTCSLGLHQEVNEELKSISKESGIEMELASDGLSVRIEMTR